MERLRLLGMTVVLTVLIWAAADSLVTDVGSVGLSFQVAAPANMIVRLNSTEERFELQVSGPRRTVEAVQAHGTYTLRWPVEERASGEATVPLDRPTLKRRLAEQWSEFGKLAVVSIQPETLSMVVDHWVTVEADLVMSRFASQFEIEPRLQRNTVTVKMRESALGGQPADQRMQIDVAPDIERLLKDQPVGRTVTLSLRLDARRFGSDAELTPNTVEFTTSVRSQRVVERIPTVPVLLAMSFTTLEVPLQAVGRDGTPLTLVTQTITVTGVAEEVKRLARGETRAYGVIQIKEEDLAETGVLKLATPDYFLPKGVELEEPPPPIEFQLISRKDSTQNP